MSVYFQLGGDFMARFSNETANTLISGTSSDDYIWNSGNNVTISAGNGNDTVNNYDNFWDRANSVQIYTGDVMSSSTM